MGLLPLTNHHWNIVVFPVSFLVPLIRPLVSKYLLHVITGNCWFAISERIKGGGLYQVGVSDTKWIKSDLRKKRKSSQSAWNLSDKIIMSKLLLICGLAIFCQALAAPQPKNDDSVLKKAQPCDPKVCVAPDCRCSSTVLDSSIPIAQTPQVRTEHLIDLWRNTWGLGFPWMVMDIVIYNEGLSRRYLCAKTIWG